MNKLIRKSVILVMTIVATLLLGSCGISYLGRSSEYGPVNVGITNHGNEINTAERRLITSNINLHGIDINYSFWAAHDSEGIIAAQLMSITLERRSHVVLYVGRSGLYHWYRRGEISTLGVWKNTELQDIKSLTRAQQLAHPSKISIQTVANINQAIGTYRQITPSIAELGIARVIIELPEGTHIIGPSNGYWFQNANRRILMAMTFNYDSQFSIRPSSVPGKRITAPNLPNWHNPVDWRLNSAPRLPLRSNLNSVIYFTTPTQYFNGINIRYGNYLNNFVFDDNVNCEMPDEEIIRNTKWRASVSVTLPWGGSGIIFYSIDSLDGYRYYYILTNEHVVNPNFRGTDRNRFGPPAGRYVYDYQDRRTPATLIYMRRNYDLAVLRTRRPAYHQLAVIEKEIKNTSAETPMVILSRRGIAEGINFGTVTISSDDRGSGLVTVPVMLGTAFAYHGTSGSGVLNADLRLIGIVFAGRFTTTGHQPHKVISIPIEQVHNFLNNYVWHLIRR